MTGWRGGLRAALGRGAPLLGTFIKTADPAIAEILALAGFDLLVADLEHSTLALADVVGIVRAAELHAVPVIVRVSAADLDAAGRLLETGAIGIQVTGVERAETLARMRAATRFAPAGARSLAVSHRVAAFGRTSIGRYVDEAAASLVTVAQLESRAAVAALPALLDSPDAPDVWFIGPVDLANDLGHPGGHDHPEVTAVLGGVLDALRDRRAAIGVFARDAADAIAWRARGAQLILLGSDVTLLADAARAAVRGVQDRSA